MDGCGGLRQIEIYWRSRRPIDELQCVQSILDSLLLNNDGRRNSDKHGIGVVKSVADDCAGDAFSGIVSERFWMCLRALM